jgi:beta-glucanase (GH16 family)
MVRTKKIFRILNLVFLAGLAVSLLGIPTGISAQPNDAPAWKLFWSDEFNGTGGIDPSRWLCDTGTSYPGGPANWGTGEVETYTCSLDNLFVEGGYLHIRVLHNGSDPLKGWTSSRIETVRTDFQPPDGGALAVEARIQLPNLNGASAQGYWPAFWMLGSPFRGNYWNWPSIGEIDIMENINGLNQWWGTFHCGTYPGGQCNEPNGIGGNYTGFSPSFQEAFHTYRMEFDKSVTPQQLRWYIDGVQRFIVLSDQVNAATWNEATNHGFFILLNVAIGGGWAGNPTDTTATGGTMLVDYVHIDVWPLQLVYLPLVLRDWCSPTIVFTVPPYGSFDDLRGYVSCVVPDNYKVVVYIFFAELNRWFIRPCCDDPLTVIQPDGSWIADITSFEYDQYANSIAVFLIPNGYNPPFEDLTTELYKNAVAFAFVDR